MEGVVSVSRQDLETAIREMDLWSDGIPTALQVAEQVHSAQKRAGGGPYLEEHIYPVTASVARFLSGHDREQARDGVLVALLHDTIEDSAMVTKETIESHFGSVIADRVDILTKPEKRAGTSPDSSDEAESKYVHGVREADYMTRAIKVLDRLNNLGAVYHRDPQRRRRYLDETRAHYLDLAESVDPSLLERMRELLDQQEQRFQRETSG